jgi:hypothetical protein
MVEPAEDQDVQTMTAVGKVLVTDDSTALLLSLLGFSATKLWNTAVWHAKEVWKTTGKIPSYAKMDVAIKQGGLYVCNQCGAVINADVNGAINILKRYLPEQIGVFWSSGCLAQPAVNRFAWRKTRPAASAHKPGTWQTSLPHLRTGSAAALSTKRA